MDPISAAMIAISMFGDFPCGNISALREELVKRGPPVEHVLYHTKGENPIPVEGHVAWNSDVEGKFILYSVMAMTPTYDGCRISVKEVDGN